MELIAGEVVVASATWLGKSVVGIVDLLEFFGARAAFGTVGGDAIRVVS
jgi:hypothetical protein